MKKQHSVVMPPPIFVAGAPRSGTTLLAKILGRHPRIFMPGETHFFDDIYSRRTELGELNNKGTTGKVVARLKTLYQRYDEQADQLRVETLLQTHNVIEELANCTNYKAIFSCFMDIQMKAVGKVRWGNNVPKDLFHARDIMSFFPDAKFLVCVRDVRDFLLSYKNKWKNTGYENANRVRMLYHPVLASLLWRASVDQISQLRAFIPRQNLMLVQYENLVEKPEKVIREICHFLGEKFEADMLNVDEGNSSFQVTEKGIYTASVGRWHRLLTSEEAYIAQNLNKNRLRELGYSISKLKINLLKVGFMYATLPYGLWRAIRANREIRGPLLPYIARRLMALCYVPAR